MFSPNPPAASYRDVSYSCGSCGYALNLSSSNRNTTGINSKYGKSIKKGVVSFDSIDETRFAHRDDLACLPCCFTFTPSLRRRTRLACNRCGRFIGTAYKQQFKEGDCKRYDIRIGALQPYASDSATQLVA